MDGSGDRETRIERKGIARFRIYVVSTTKRRYHEAHGVVALPSPRIDVVDGVERAAPGWQRSLARGTDVTRVHVDGDTFTRPSPRDTADQPFTKWVSHLSIVCVVSSGRPDATSDSGSFAIVTKPWHRRRQSLSITSYIKIAESTRGVLTLSEWRAVHWDDSRVTTLREGTTKTRKRTRTIKWTVAIARGSGWTIVGRGQGHPQEASTRNVQGFRPQPARGSDASRVRRER